MAWYLQPILGFYNRELVPILHSLAKDFYFEAYVVVWVLVLGP